MPNTLEPSGERKRSSSIIRSGIYVLPIVLACILLYVLNTTSPTTTGVMGILVVFLLLYAFSLSAVFVFLHLASKLLKRLRPKISIDSRRSYYLAMVLALLPVFLLALSSIGQLRATDVGLILCFLALASFYVIRRTA